MPRKLRAIFFDVDDTLFSTSEFASRARRAAIEAMRGVGLDYPHEYLQRELDEVVGEFTANYGHHIDKLLLRIPTTAYAGVNPAIIVAAGVVAYHQTKFTELQAYPDARELLERLSRTDLVRGIITAGREIKQAEKLIRLDIVKFLSPYAIFISDQIGISKPNIKLYQRACSDLGLDPAETMYVGDNPANDIVPPSRIGMITVRHRGGGKYSEVEVDTKPDFEIRSFDELVPILADEFGVVLEGGAVSARGVAEH